jgi:hypothetical protein
MHSHVFIAHHQNMQFYFVNTKASLMCELYWIQHIFQTPIFKPLKNKGGYLPSPQL